MQTIEGDVRRYAWTRGQAFWRMGMPVTALLEDSRGGAADDQLGLLRHASRNIGMHCATVLALVERGARPIPPSRAQPSWALERIAGHPLAPACRALIVGDDTLDVGQLLERGEQLVAEVTEIAGRAPDPMSPDGYFPALARAREWLRLADLVGEEGFLPREWTGAL